MRRAMGRLRAGSTGSPARHANYDNEEGENREIHGAACRELAGVAGLAIAEVGKPRPGDEASVGAHLYRSQLSMVPRPDRRSA